MSKTTYSPLSIFCLNSAKEEELDSRAVYVAKIKKIEEYVVKAKRRIKRLEREMSKLRAAKTGDQQVIREGLKAYSLASKISLEQ